MTQFSVWLRNCLVSAGLEPVLSDTEKSCKASYYIKYSTNIKIKEQENGLNLNIFILISAESCLYDTINT